MLRLLWCCTPGQGSLDVPLGNVGTTVWSIRVVAIVCLRANMMVDDMLGLMDGSRGLG